MLKVMVWYKNAAKMVGKNGGKSDDNDMMVTLGGSVEAKLAGEGLLWGLRVVM